MAEKWKRKPARNVREGVWLAELAAGLQVRLADCVPVGADGTRGHAIANIGREYNGNNKEYNTVHPLTPSNGTHGISEMQPAGQ